MKKIISISLSAAMLSASLAVPAMAEDDIKVLVNGEAVTFTEAAPFIEDGRTLVPMRAIFEALGASVEWDGDTRTVVSYDPISDVSIVLQIDNTKMIVDGKEITLDVPAKIVNDRTVVPVRAIAEGMNSVVDWDGEKRTVIVTKDITSAKAETETETGTEVANPWTQYLKLSGLNDALAGQYEFPAIENERLSDYAYRAILTEGLSEGLYAVDGEEETNVCIRMVSMKDQDISGIYGAEKLGEVKLSEDFKSETYKYIDKTEEGKEKLVIYTNFTIGDYTYCVAVDTTKKSESEVLELIEEVGAELLSYAMVQGKYPYAQYHKLSSLNEALDGAFEFPELKVDSLTDIRYALQFDGNVAQGIYAVKDGGEDDLVYVYMAEAADKDISGIGDADKVAKVKTGAKTETDALKSVSDGKTLYHVNYDNGKYTFAIVVDAQDMAESEALELIETVAAALAE